MTSGYRDTLIGTVLDGKYRIESFIGYGGMSIVYKAIQEPIERAVAVKTVKFRIDERPDVWRRFEREIKTLSKLSHPNIVTVYDCVIGDDGQPYVVMDYIQGESLDEILSTQGRFSIERVLALAKALCQALSYAHRHDVIHRDIKPANIMVVAAGGTSGPVEQIKVVDFGLAKLGEDSRPLTQSGELWGSPPYMSPEQIKGEAIDHRSDLYSIACVLYETITGKDPFYGANVYELLHKHVYETPPSLKEACPEAEFPQALEAVLFKAMAKNADDRYQSAKELEEAIEAAIKLGVFPQAKPGAINGQVRKPGSTHYGVSAAQQQVTQAAPVHGPFLKSNLAILLVSVAFCIGCAFYMRPFFVEKKSSLQEARLSAPNVQTKEIALPGKRIKGLSSESLPVKAQEKSRTGRQALAVASNHGKFKSVKYKAQSKIISAKSLKTPLKSPKAAVNKSKFDLLRSLKSPVLRKEAEE
jgi:serine/threonine protein kinase